MIPTSCDKCGGALTRKSVPCPDSSYAERSASCLVAHYKLVCAVCEKEEPDEGWFEIEEEVFQDCDTNHPTMGMNCFQPHRVVVKRRIRFVGQPSRDAGRWLRDAAQR